MIDRNDNVSIIRAQDATHYARAPNGDDHAKVALELAAYGWPSACMVRRSLNKTFDI